MPEISVIVAAYNAERYIRTCVGSILNQTFRDIELICVDDGSSDSTLKLLHELAQQDHRMSVLTQENKGAGAARNHGLDAASGKYSIFLDADDFFDTHMLDSMYCLAEFENLDMVICQAYEYDDKTEKTNKVLSWAAQAKEFTNTVFSYQDNPEHIFQAVNTWAWNKLIRTSVIRENNLRFQELMSSNDNLFVTSALVLCKRIMILDRPFVFYRVNNPNSLQRSKEKTWYCSCESAYAVKEKLEELGVYDELECSFINKSLKNVLYYYNTIDQKSPEREKLAQTIQGEFTEKLQLKTYPDEYFYDKKLLMQYRWIQNRVFFPADKAIPIILSSDNNYAKQMYVTIKSILDSRSESTVYDFYLLIHRNFAGKYRKDITRLSERYPGTRVKFFEMSDKFENMHLEIGHISSPTYYRLEMANILPAEYDRCIYLDTDIIVRKDLTDYFSVDLEGYYAAGVKAAAYIMNRSNLGYLNSIGIKDVEKYINAGAVLYNLKKIREDGLTDLFYKLAKNNYRSQDQDVINVAFEGHVKIIPLRYNMMTKYRSFRNSSLPEYKRILTVYSEQEIKYALDDPVIIHYAGEEKPWNSSGGLFSEYWVECAQTCPYRLYVPLGIGVRLGIRARGKAVFNWFKRPSKRKMLEDMQKQIAKLSKTVDELSAKVNKKK